MWYKNKTRQEDVSSPSRTKPSIFTRVSSSPLCSLRKQPTFLDHWFPREITSEKRAQKFHTDECQYLDLGSASDCSCRVGNLLPPIGSGCWRVICMEFSQTSFRGETSFLRFASVRKTKRPRRRQSILPQKFSKTEKFSPIDPLANPHRKSCRTPLLLFCGHFHF